MTISEVISAVDELLPNVFDEDKKAAWVISVDGKLKDRLYRHFEEDPPAGPDKGPEDNGIPLRASGPCEEMYVFYLMAMIHFYMNDIDDYENALTQYNDLLMQYMASYRQTHTSKSAGGFKNFF